MTVHVKTDGVIAIPEGFSHVHIEVVESLEVTLELKSNVTGSLYVTVEGTGDLNLIVQTSENSHYKYLWINQSNDKLHVEETLVLEKNAELIANYGEMTQGHHVKNTVVKYVGEGSRVDFRGAIISFNNLKWTIKAHHLAKKTYAMVTCNAIVLDNARLHLEVIGKIDKGFGGSETHQMSRILNLGKNVHGVVYPMLLIDENDVAASHAASVGQPNEEHIFYLQSRGLTRLESLKLIITGYLMPIVEGIDDETIKEQLRQEIMEKVNQQWD